MFVRPHSGRTGECKKKAAAGVPRMPAFVAEPLRRGIFHSPLACENWSERRDLNPRHPAPKAIKRPHKQARFY
jgi:hypothetical protein